MSNDMESRMQDQIEGAQAQYEQEQLSAMSAMIPKGGWASPREQFLVGPTVVDSQATRMCHALAQVLECLPPSEHATALTSSAWELLYQIGRYEDGFELGEGGGQP